ncbi:unnamed protein product, partial [Prorocentrum cordatum]
IETMRVSGHVEVAEGFGLALDAGLRSAELLSLLVGDAMFTDGADGRPLVAFRFGVIGRGEGAKTGAGQGALIDRQHVAQMALRRTPRQMQRRGRRASDESAMKRAKSRAHVAAGEAAPADILENGAELLRAGRRPEQ